jgi:hypothetical protein
MFIKKDMLYNLVRRAEPNSRDYEFAMLWLVAYAFMLRLPSEALQIQKDVGSEFTCGNHIYLDSSETVCLYLSSRKNKLRPSIVKRSCTCAGIAALCPVHELWFGFLEHLEIGHKPWASISPNFARAKLRATLCNIAVPNSELYGTHDFRRGHADDLRESGIPITRIVAMGGWSSEASLPAYLNMAELEMDTIFEAAIASDVEEEEWID